MAYTINRFDGSILTVVEDGTIDTNTSIKFVGKNYAGYGEVQNENFAYLLENFAGLNPPPRPISGQVWFDTDSSKLKFYDGNRFRTTGGAEISEDVPAGLTEGDFWWDTENQQLFAYNGNDFVLVGPQDAGEGVTQMQSRTVLDTQGVSRSVIVSVLNDTVVHIISDRAFTIAPSPENSIPGFDVIKKGVNLVNTLGATGGVTSTDHVFWGTASNANKLGGIDASNFVQSGSAVFDNLIELKDIGLAIGDSNDLRIFVDNDNEGIISNEIGNQIRFRAKDSQGVIKNSVVVKPGSLIPGETNEAVTIGTDSERFSEIFADRFSGLSEKTESLVVSGNSLQGDIQANPNTIAVRDASGDLRANLFRGTALTAKYADLAEIYSTGSQLEPGTVVSVCSHSDHDVCPADESHTAIGVVSTNPAYVMNSEAKGQPIAFVGRVYVRILGDVYKSEKIYASDSGLASVSGKGSLIGIALENSFGQSEKLVECLLKV